MNNSPFLLRFKRRLEQINHDIENLIRYDENLQYNKVEDYIPWHVWYTTCHTPAKYIKGHRSRATNKWIPGRIRPAKRDRRQSR